MIRSAHLLELRTALAELYAAAGQSTPVFSDSVATGTIIRAVHITELRNAVRILDP
jgi:hypothetical protein